VQLFPSLQGSNFTVAPLYTLHYVLQALAAYRSVWNPPQVPAPLHTAMPVTHWALWTLIPRTSLFLALIATLILFPAPVELVLTLLGFAGLREVLAAFDQRRVMRALHDAQRQADDAAQQTVDFLARIVHDIAAPLQGLQTVAAYARTSVGDPAIVTPLQDQLAHLDQLIDQLRSYLQSRTAPLVIGKVDVAPICAAALHAVESHADTHNIHLRLVFDIETAIVFGDAAAIRRILDNLLINAIAATPAGGEVVLRIHTESRSMITLSVMDAGEGIPPQHQQHIFEPLVRFREDTGLGLGLAIVRELTRAMSGECGVTSNTGVGSTFWVRLHRAVERPREGDHDNRTRD
jgi:signal transduction histidine kinase